jgi:hypothetical protein
MLTQINMLSDVLLLGRAREHMRLRCLIASPALLVSTDEVIEQDAVAAVDESGFRQGCPTPASQQNRQLSGVDRQ